MDHLCNMTTAISNPTKEVIQGLWIGSELSTLERLSIASFLACGHQYVLYTCGYVAGVPGGTSIKDGNEILHKSLIFQVPPPRELQRFREFLSLLSCSWRRAVGGWTRIPCVSSHSTFPMNMSSRRRSSMTRSSSTAAS